jgi:hypothetical protein
MENSSIASFVSNAFEYFHHTGTRVPVYDVAASVAAGYPMDRILASYPSLSREQVELAALYAEANPQRGRPKQSILPLSGMKVIASRRKLRSVPR